MRPRHDVASPEADPAEVMHHVREAAARWQETAERIARQRDEALAISEDRRVALSTIEAILDARDITEKEALDAIGREVDRVPDGASQVPA